MIIRLLSPLGLLKFPNKLARFIHTEVVLINTFLGQFERLILWETTVLKYTNL